ncbi:MAG: LemA family protein, partial [Patescibacteria group bacterium]
MPTIIWVVIIAVAAIVLWLVAVYNGLIRLRNQTDEAWSDIDVQLKRRYDLIPNLVESVKGYATHERELFERVTQARAAAMGAQTVDQKGKAENMLAGTLKSLFAVAESYPDLKANQNFLALQEELSSTENKIGFSRQYYNDAAMRMN